MYFSYNAYHEVDIDVEIPEEQVRCWALELDREENIFVSREQAKNDLENIYISLRKYKELALASRLDDIIRVYF